MNIAVSCGPKQLIKLCVENCVCLCVVCVNEREPRCQWERREGGRECGNKDRGKRKEIERGSFAQPSITFLGFKFIWLHFSLKYTAHRRGERAGGWGDGEKTAWRESNIEWAGGGGLPGSERMRREAVREERRRGRRSPEIQRERGRMCRRETQRDK